MKKLLSVSLLFAAALFLTGNSAFAQCTPSETGCAFDPEVNGGLACFAPAPLPNGTVGTPYDEVFYFRSAKALPPPVNQELNKIEMNDVLRLPAGLQFESVSGNPADASTPNIFTPVAGSEFGPFGCVRLFGTPTEVKGAAGTHEDSTINIQITINDVFTPSLLSNFGIVIDLPLLVSGTSGTAERIFENNLNLNVYPNPVGAKATISYNVAEVSDVAISIVALDGREVYRNEVSGHLAGQTSLELDTNSFPQGVYMVTISSGSANVTKKFVKAN
jgi:hypothetical protein